MARERSAPPQAAGRSSRISRQTRPWVLPATRLSDHASFWDHGFPAVMITDTAFFRNPYYHTPDDTMETLDFRFMAELVRSLELALGRLET